MSGQFRSAVARLFLAAVLLTGCGKKKDPEPSACEDYGGQVFPVTTGPAADEDGGFIVGDDGTLYFAFISDRAGNIDTWITSSSDGRSWSTPWSVEATSDDELYYPVRTRDGQLHLVGRRLYFTYHTVALSSDLHSWSTPEMWTEPTYLAAGQLQDDASGTYWLVFASDQTGNWDLYIQSSVDQGANWTTPVPIVSDPMEDFVFSFRITPDGQFLLLWLRYDPTDPDSYVGASSDIYWMTSDDGVTWTTPVLVTPNGGTPVTDTIPWLIDGPDGDIWALWLTTRYPQLGFVTVVAAPVYPNPALDDWRVVPAEGYSVRSQPLPDGRTILAWVASSQDGSWDNYARFVCDFDFERVP